MKTSSGRRGSLVTVLPRWATASATAAAMAAGAPTTPDSSIADFLGPLDDELRLFGFDQFHLYRRESARWRFNWKMGIEGFFENYHFAVLHRNSTSRIFLHNTNVYDTFGPHLRVVPAKRSMLGLRDRPESEWDIRPHATLLYGIFPATFLFIEKNHLSVLQAMPETPASTLAHISHIVAKDGLSYRHFWEKNIESFMSAVREDFDTAEAMTEGLAAGLGPDHVVFGRNEGACIEYRKAIDNMVEMRGTVQPAAKPAGNEPGSRH